MADIFIYALKCPIADQIRYVGKAMNPARRLKAHMRGAAKRKSHKDNWLFLLQKECRSPELVILHTVAPGDDWAEMERRAIATGRALGWPLTNLTHGGEGASLTLEERERKKAIMGRAETRMKMSRAAKARWQNPELLAAALQSASSAEKRARLSEAARARSTPEYRAKMAEKTKATWADREKRARILAGITEEVRAKVSAAAKAMWQDAEKAAAFRANLTSPAAKEKLAKTLASEEYRAKRRAIWARPGHKEKVSDSFNNAIAARKRDLCAV